MSSEYKGIPDYLYSHSEKPNNTWIYMSYYINILASEGATDFELRSLVKKEGSATLDDIAKIQVACMKRNSKKSKAEE